MYKSWSKVRQPPQQPTHLGQVPDCLGLARASGANERAAVETLERLGEGEDGALSQRCDDQGGGGAQVLVVVKEVVGQLLDIARTELVVSGHRRLGARQHGGIFC